MLGLWAELQLNSRFWKWSLICMCTRYSSTFFVCCWCNLVIEGGWILTCRVNHMLTASFQIQWGGVKRQNYRNCVTPETLMDLTVFASPHHEGISVYGSCHLCTELLTADVLLSCDHQSWAAGKHFVQLGPRRQHRLLGRLNKIQGLDWGHSLWSECKQHDHVSKEKKSLDAMISSTVEVILHYCCVNVSSAS